MVMFTYDDDYVSSEGLYNTNLLAYKANMYIFSNSVSCPFFTYLVKDKIFNDYDYDRVSRCRGQMDRPRPLCQPVVPPVVI